MKTNYIFLITLSAIVSWAQAQTYTWEKYNTPTAGGQQGNGSYSAFTSTSWHITGEVNTIDHSGNTGFLIPRIDTRPPVITSITDVPNDQGKRVQIVWNRSDYDELYNLAQFYSVWRQDEGPTAQYQESKSSVNIDEVLEFAGKFPEQNWFWLAGGAVWTYVGQVPALAYSEYAFNAPTLFDFFPPDILNMSTFKVVFHAVDDFYESIPFSGYSIDNLAPAEPLLTGGFMVSHAQLDWDESSAEDFQYFAIYKSTDPDGIPVEPYATTTVTQFIDYELGGDPLYYTVTAWDVNGNESGLSNLVEVDTRLMLDLTVFLEGPFSGTEMQANLNNTGLIPSGQPYFLPPWNYAGQELFPEMPNGNITDWVLIELRDAPDAGSATASTAIARQAAFVQNDGKVVATDGINIPGFSAHVTQHLFVVIWHRNHLAIMSAEEPILTSGVLSYDFSTDANQVLGAEAGYKELASGIWGMVAGDGNADGIINEGDKIISWGLEAGKAGYLQGDFNLDGEIDNPDKNESWLINSGKECQVPE